MSPLRLLLFAATTVVVCAALQEVRAQDLPPIPPIERRIPPKGSEIPAEDREFLAAGVKELSAGLADDPGREHAADVEIFAKAIDFALRHGEFFKEKKDVALAKEVLAAGLDRLNNPPDPDERGLLVRGYESSIDGSPQPYGLEIPEGLSLEQPVPLYVWLHGRGDTKTNLYFIHERMTKGGKFEFADGIVLHPFGRQCIGWKGPGEIDVLEAIKDVKKRYPIDEDRIALMGFSMGGAGAWHIGAHYADKWCVVHAGAGFAETAEYNKLTPDHYPPEYEQTLWRLYDVPNYVRNLFNVPVIAYSGSEDKQIQAARVMEEAFAGHGRELTHLIGPGMGHKYHPDTQAEVKAFIQAAVKKGRDAFSKEVHLQTRTARYGEMHWVNIAALEEEWKDARIDARQVSPGNLMVTTSNVSLLWLWELPDLPPSDRISLLIDGQSLQLPYDGSYVVLEKHRGQWREEPKPGREAPYRKLKDIQGPIDDAFRAPFLVIAPDRSSKNPKVQRWVEFELARFKRRWRELFRGELPVKKASEVTEDDLAGRHLVAWGDPDSNRFIPRELGESGAVGSWSGEVLKWGDEEFDARNHVPMMITPNPGHPSRYLVINSGPTFREAHDRTNSLQNPKLGDWAIVNLDTLPDAEAPGEVVAAGFFDGNWELPAP